MSDSFISQIAISRVEVYNMLIEERNPTAVCILNNYYKESGRLIERYIIAHRTSLGPLKIEGASHVAGSNANYFRNLLSTVRTPTPTDYCHALEFVRAEIMGLISSTLQNLENLLH
jgi:hypothetical protein